MTFIHTFDNKIRFLVLYQDVSKKSTVIQKYTGISLRTIQDWTAKTEQNINILEHAKGQGRKRSISEAKKKKIVRTARRAPSSSSTRKLANQYEVGKSSTHRVLQEKKFKFAKVKKRKALTPQEMENRVNFCRDMLLRNNKRLRNSFFGDEMGINLSDCHPDKVWIPPRKKVKVDKPKKDVRLNCWGAISYNGATNLHIYKGSLKSDRYENILEEHKEEMDELYPRGYDYHHDNPYVHTAAEEWMLGQHFKIGNFPTYSPDLTPIENLWSTLKTAVAKDNPKTEDKLRKSLLKNWENLTEINRLRPYFDGLVHRYKECIDKLGERLDY